MNQITRDDTECLKEAFALFDADKDGEITVQELAKVSHLYFIWIKPRTLHQINLKYFLDIFGITTKHCFTVCFTPFKTNIAQNHIKNPNQISLNLTFPELMHRVREGFKNKTSMALAI